MIELLQEHSERIVIFGQSCVGKTTFAKQIPCPYLCFDSLFPWHSIEALGLSLDAAMNEVKRVCESHSKFVLDGWHLSDDGSCFPDGATAYVLIATYERIIEQYRVPVDDFLQHLNMFEKWYSIKYPSPTRYFVNNGSFEEISKNDFLKIRNESL